MDWFLHSAFLLCLSTQSTLCSMPHSLIHTHLYSMPKDTQACRLETGAATNLLITRQPHLPLTLQPFKRRLFLSWFPHPPSAHFYVCIALSLFYLCGCSTNHSQVGVGVVQEGRYTYFPFPKPGSTYIMFQSLLVPITCLFEDLQQVNCFYLHFSSSLSVCLLKYLPVILPSPLSLQIHLP